MMIAFHPTLIAVLFLVLAIVTPAHADVQEVFSFDEWQATVDAYSTITFTEYPGQTFITTQYQDLGVTFTDGNDFIQSGVASFVTDFAGLNGRFDDQITLVFSTPQMWLAIDYPGIVVFELYDGDDLIYKSGAFGGGEGLFTGLISTRAFDKAVIFDPLLIVAIDNLYFGGVPAPATLPLLTMSLLRSPRRRR